MTLHTVYMPLVQANEAGSGVAVMRVGSRVAVWLTKISFVAYPKIFIFGERRIGCTSELCRSKLPRWI